MMCSLSPKRYVPRNRSRKAFTLLELLVVIAIIATLSVLLIPGISKMTEGAKSAKCLSNLRQIGIGLLGYAGEHDGKLPPNLTTANDPEFTDGYANWVERTAPYVGQEAKSNTSVWICPGIKYKIPQIVNGTKVTSYSIHGAFIQPEGDPTKGNYEPRLRLGSIPRHSEMILVADGVQESITKPLPALMIYWPNSEVYDKIFATELDKPFAPGDANKYGNLSYHHRGDYCNTVLVDGSARSFKLGEVLYRNTKARVK